LRVIALAILGLFLAIAFASVETANEILVTAKDSVVRYFDWLFVSVATGSLLFVVVLGIIPRANVRLGGPGSQPDFSRFSWFAMLFSAGLASGLLYWAAAEPVIHFQGNPLLVQAGVAASSEGAMGSALLITIFHWGLHGWGMYVMGALAISVYAYRHDRPLTIRTALYPLLGPTWIDRWPGRLVDLIALLGTVFGVATSIGLSASALNATLSSIVGISISVPNQIAIVAVVCALGVVSAVSGLGRGIRRLSELNVWVSSAFLLGVFMLGPSLTLIETFFTAALDYVWNVLPLGLWLGTNAEEIEWQSAWTIFYWGWWLAWMPFVSLFIARISSGRTVREFVMAVMGVPTLMIILWMSVLGGTALEQELANRGSISAAVNQDYSRGIVAVLDQFTVPVVPLVLTYVAAFLLFTWLITSLDSATLVLCHLVERPDATSQQILWGLILAAVTSTLIFIGGLDALQAASIVIGLPLAIVTVLIGAGLLKDLVRGKL
jgi:choline/glycine/proline betaine transport protein